MSIAVPSFFLMIQVLTRRYVVFFSMLPLMIMFRSEQMRAVLDSIYRPAKSLLSILFLAILLLLIVSFINFFVFADYFMLEECSTTLGMCWFYTVFHGVLGSQVLDGQELDKFTGMWRSDDPYTFARHEGRRLLGLHEDEHRRLRNPGEDAAMILTPDKIIFDLVFFLLFTTLIYSMLSG